MLALTHSPPGTPAVLRDEAPGDLQVPPGCRGLARSRLPFAEARRPELIRGDERTRARGGRALHGARGPPSVTDLDRIVTGAIGRRSSKRGEPDALSVLMLASRRAAHHLVYPHPPLGRTSSSRLGRRPSTMGSLRLGPAATRSFQRALVGVAGGSSTRPQALGRKSRSVGHPSRPLGEGLAPSWRASRCGPRSTCRPRRVIAYNRNDHVASCASGTKAGMEFDREIVRRGLPHVALPGAARSGLNPPSPRSPPSSRPL